MEQKRLTIIIPFLLEKEEVEQTLKSMCQHLQEEVNIILINDASKDEYDYRTVAERYGALYIENEERIGVAACRDIGVELCTTPYFLLLDAHMRFYNNRWLGRIVEELEKDSRTLICCQTKFLSRENGVLIDTPECNAYTSGATVRYNMKEELIYTTWQTGTPFDQSQLTTIDISCVLGAAYACSKDYWQYLKGLHGLRYYGSDEPYISMKVWMEGGRCKLLKDVVIGHIYRSASIYHIPLTFRLFNQVMMAELLLPAYVKKRLWAEARDGFGESFPEALYVLYQHKDEIIALKNYYQSIFTRDYAFFEQLNNSYLNVQSPIQNFDNTIHQIYQGIENCSVLDSGLLEGRMGIILFLFHYGKMFNCSESTNQAEHILEEIFENIQLDTHYGLKTGLAGIGWGIQYLYQQGFIEGNVNEIVEDIDLRIMEIDPARVLNLHREYGLGGIVLYLLARLYSIEKEKLENPFDEKYLQNVYDRIHSLMISEDFMYDSMDVFLDFMAYFERTKELDAPSAFDVFSPVNMGDKTLDELSIGLNGASGMGLKLLAENNYSI